MSPNERARTTTDLEQLESLAGLCGFGIITADSPATGVVRVSIEERHDDERAAVLSRWASVMHVARMTAGKYNKQDPSVWLNLQGAFDASRGVLGANLLPHGQLLLVRAPWAEGTSAASAIHTGVSTKTAQQVISQLG